MVKFLFLFLVFFGMTAVNSQTLTWKFVHPKTDALIDFGTKGSVQEKLIEIGELPDPFYGENEKEFSWIENHKWYFISEFEVSTSILDNEFVILNFPVVDTYAEIKLNDSLIANTDNAFRPYRLNVKKWIKPGKNTLKVIFTPPILYHKKAFEKRASKLPAPNDVGSIAVASMSRKPQYQFGWDWALRMNTIGFWKEVTLEHYNHNKIIQAKYETQNIQGDLAKMKATFYADQKTNQTTIIKSKLFGKKVAQMLNGVIELDFDLKNPILWNPKGHGEQHLYSDTVLIYDKNQQLIGVKTLKFGVRIVELIQEKDQWGTSFYFKVNGKSIFAKGGNMIPMDVFPSRVTDEMTRSLVEQCSAANFNMIRVWGGGYYQDDVFYERCDELGIMVWQDLMFACAMYPGDQRFLKSVEEELNFQIPRIASHPSVVYFNGNNEVDVAWKNWGFQVTYMIGPKMQKQIELDYKKLFKELAPIIISKHTNVPYVHTSPLSNWGKEEYFNHGTMHYWGVWHGKDPIEDFGNKTGRFNAEYGFQSFPEYSTLETFSEQKDWYLLSSVMKHHQKSYVGNGMIKKHADLLYGEAENFNEFVYFSQLTQAKAVSIAISGHRLDSPKTMGTLFWQINDCWPAPTWSSIDYYFNWKALHYSVKLDYEPITVLAQTKKIGAEKYFFINELDSSFVSELQYEVFDLNGKPLFANFFTIHVKPNWKQEICEELNQSLYRNKDYVVSFSWTNEKGEKLYRQFFHEVNQKRIKAKSDAVELKITSHDTANKKLTIEVSSSEFITDLWIYSKKGNCQFSSNFITLLPNKSIKIEVTYTTKEALNIEDFDKIWR